MRIKWSMVLIALIVLDISVWTLALSTEGGGVYEEPKNYDYYVRECEKLLEGQVWWGDVVNVSCIYYSVGEVSCRCKHETINKLPLPKFLENYNQNKINGVDKIGKTNRKI